MTILTPSFDYSDRDFYSLRLRLQNLIRSVFEDWTDFNTANFGNILLELFAYVGDILNYYQDRQALEAFWPTLTQRISAIRQGALIDFSLPSAAAATGTIRLTTPYPDPSNSATIEVGHQFISLDPANPVHYQALSEATLAAGGTQVDIDVEASETKEASFQSTDEPSQSFPLPNTPFLDGSIDEVVWDGSTLMAGVTADDGDYTLVSSFLGQGPTDKVFVVFVDQFEKAHVRFGNGASGSIPQGTIRVKYKIGGGTGGNAEANMKFESVDPIVFTSGTPVTYTLYTPAGITGGAERMSLAAARSAAPASISVQGRTVASTDFEISAKSIAGVARALLATSNEYPGIEENTGILYVVAQGTKLPSGRIEPDSPSAIMLTAIETYINTEKPPTTTFRFSAAAATFLSVNLSARVYLVRGASQTIVGAAIRTAVRDFFACQLSDGQDNPGIDFGAKLIDAIGDSGELAWSDVFNAIRDVDGVRKVDEGTNGLLINGLRSSLELSPIEFPKFGSITLINADTEVAF